MIYIIGWISWTRKMITLFIIFLARFVLFPAPFFFFCGILQKHFHVVCVEHNERRSWRYNDPGLPLF